MFLNEHLDDIVMGYKKGFPIMITVNFKITAQWLPKWLAAFQCLQATKDSRDLDKGWAISVYQFKGEQSL